MNGAEETQVALSWEPMITVDWSYAAAVAAVVLLWLSWRSSRGLKVPRRMTLLLLRLITVVLLALLLAGPSRVTTTGRLTRDPFVVLIDASRSMRVEDAAGRTRAAQVGEWLAERSPEFDKLGDEVDVRYVLFGDELTTWSGSDEDGPSESDGRRAPPRGDEQGAAGAGGPGTGEPSPADRRATDIGAALFGLPDVLQGSRPAGVLLVSDGADRAALGRALTAEGPGAVERLTASLRYPISTWSVGDDGGAPDLAVAKVDAPPFGFVRRPLTVTAHISNRSVAPRPMTVSLRGEGEILASQEITVPKGELGEVVFEVKPDAIGYHTYEVEIPVPGEDTIPSNNRLEFTVKVVRDRTRVLQVTSRPSWDVKFLRRLLKTDPNIDLVSFFILRNNNDGELVRIGKPYSLIEFPYKELFDNDLQGFDLVIFQNFWFGSFSPLDDRFVTENIASYVQEGGAFLMVGGDTSFGEAQYGRSALSTVMPTLMPETPTTNTPFQGRLTEAGLRHPVTRLTRDPSGNTARWEGLPSLQGLNPLGDLQEGSASLVDDGAGRTVVAARSVGRGRTMAVATDTTWNWALAGKEGLGAGSDHATFWRNAVRWLVKDVEQKQVQVITDKENYRLGETIQAQVRVLDEQYAPRADVAVEGLAVPIRGGEPEAFEGVTDASGQIAVGIPADREGTLRITADVPAIGGEFGAAEVRVSVTDREGELEDPAARPDLLAAIAQATGGKTFTEAPDPLDATRLPIDALMATDRKVEPLWAHPLLLLLLILPLGGEWILRRRMGLR